MAGYKIWHDGTGLSITSINIFTGVNTAESFPHLSPLFWSWRERGREGGERSDVTSLSRRWEIWCSTCLWKLSQQKSFISTFSTLCRDHNYCDVFPISPPSPPPPPSPLPPPLLPIQAWVTFHDNLAKMCSIKAYSMHVQICQKVTEHSPTTIENFEWLHSVFTTWSLDSYNATIRSLGGVWSAEDMRKCNHGVSSSENNREPEL